MATKNKKKTAEQKALAKANKLAELQAQAPYTLSDATDKIQTILEFVDTTSKLNYIEIAKVMGNVRTYKLYETEGYKNATEYAMDKFGWAHANASRMAQIGEKLNAGLLPDGFTTGQYGEMLSLPAETLKAAAESGEITPDMTSKEIREKVATFKTPKENSRTEKLYVFECLSTGDCTDSAESSFKAIGVRVKYDDDILYIVKTDSGYDLWRRGAEIVEPDKDAAE